jgi:sensor histidine kinase YesM
MALGAQFAAFTLLYFVDSTVTTRGWTPPWYATYRFVLTFVVGASIIISLIGRGEIGDSTAKKKMPGAIDRIKSEDQGQTQRAKYEAEKAKILDKKEEKRREQEEKERKEQERQEKEKQEKEKEANKDGKEGDGKNENKESKEDEKK